MRKEAIALLQTTISSGTADERKLALWKRVCIFSDYPFQTSERVGKSGIKFKYTVSKPGSTGGCHYEGESIDGYGNEMWISTSEGEKKKSNSRSMVERAMKTSLEMDGKVPGLKALNVPGAHSYLYPIFVRFGVIKEQG